jgi:hypothetical protein
VNVTTYHNDNSRTGQNTAETALTTTNVTYTKFGRLFTVALDGQVYAQPLVLSGVVIAGVAHNVVYVATEHDSVYALDAASGQQYWKTSFLSSGVTTAPTDGDGINCGDLNGPEYGITGTPVINPSTNTLYVVAETYESGSHVHRLHALDVRTGLQISGVQPVVIAATANGDTFDALHHINRPGLLLENNHLIIAWGSHCDDTPYFGWVMSYNAATLQQEAVYNDDQAGIQLNGGKGAGIWMGGGGVASDSAGNLYFSTGNGDFGTLPSPTDLGDSIIKLSPPPPTGGLFSVADWFTPRDQDDLDAADTDVGSGGVLLLPDQPAGDTHQQLLVQMGKEGALYLVDRNNMGHYCSGCSDDSDTNIVQEIPNATVGVWGSPAYWNGNVYFGGANTNGSAGPVKAFSLYSTTPKLELTSQTSESFHFSTPTPSVSSNGTSNGILWFLDNGSWKTFGSAVLHAFNATNLSAPELYNSSQVPSRDQAGEAVKFTVPTIANGKVYVGGASNSAVNGQLTAYGELNYPPLSCSASVSCTIPVNTVIAQVSLTCNEYAQISTSATACQGSCNTSQSSGYYPSLNSQTGEGGFGTASCTLKWSWGGNNYQETLHP